MPAGYTGVDNVVINLISYTGSLFESISFDLEDMSRQIKLDLQGKVNPNPKVSVKLEFLIEKHVKAVKFTRKLEKLVTSLTLIQFVGAAIQICLTGFSILAARDSQQILTFTFYFITMFSQPFIVCAVGSSLQLSVS